ncbi:MAG TPA: hypothetical protein VJX23_12530 [Candidatus Binataceae bacterium]|nr:hypothetical protein [Candidatus Binataceae bacterium]
MKKARQHITFLFLSAMAAAFCACGGGSGSGGSSTPAVADPCRTLPPATAVNFLVRLTPFMNALCYQKQNWEHDAQVRTSDGVHPFVKVWYSPALFNWITVSNRQGSVPDGAMIVKEQYQTLTAPLTEWTVMVKDSKLSWDGWYWADLSNPTPRNPNANPTPGPNGACAEPQVLFNGTALYCVNCHASAINNQGTYSSTEYINAPASAGASANVTALEDMHNISRLQAVNALEEGLAPKFVDRVPSSVFSNLKALPGSVPCMVSQGLDHVVPLPQSAGGPQEFVTSDQCANCHDATGTLAGAIPNMIYGGQTASPVNLSPYGEWRYSMMGLAGRDPIFFAQLDTESTLHAQLAGQANGSAFVQNLCLRCHGVMGQRQYHLDKGNGPDTLFTRDQLQDPDSKYAALGRDGISCAVCHHISDVDLGDPSTFTGLFNVGPANVIYGPFPSDPDPSGAKSGDSVIPLPMQNTMGITPTQGLQIQQASLCSSCHEIVLPVFDAKGNQVSEHGEPKFDNEQTTFFEWLNSNFSTVPCQTCHMPDTYQGNSLQFKIANIEDNTFPAIPATGPSTRLPDADLILETRSPYLRHQLLGINVFALEMFDQFRADLGLFKIDPNLPGALAKQISGQKTAAAEAVLEAQTNTAQVTVESATRAGGVLQADVQVQNLAGHNFPSGVSFRRAFINFQVLDGAGNVLWASGNTNSDGVIVDNSGNPLVTEFFSPTQQSFQPHFWTGNPITTDSQVQIYEELATDPQGLLTTSFLSLDTKVKDNRLQPQGRSSTGPNAGILAPVGTGSDPSYQGGCGCSVVRYEVPLTGSVANAVAVQATVYYQSIPPYYLRQRSEEGHGPDTARLVNFTSQLNVGSQYPAIANWKLQIATSGSVNIQ